MKIERHTRKIPWLAIAPLRVFSASARANWQRNAEEAAEVASTHRFTIRIYLTTDGTIL